VINRTLLNATIRFTKLNIMATQ